MVGPATRDGVTAPVNEMVQRHAEKHNRGRFVSIGLGHNRLVSSLNSLFPDRGNSPSPSAFHRFSTCELRAPPRYGKLGHVLITV